MSAPGPARAEGHVTVRCVEHPQEPSRDLRSRAAANCGVVLRRDLLADGIGPNSIQRHVRMRQWQRIFRGAYLLESRPVVWSDRARAALMVCGRDCALGSGTAAHLLGLVSKPPELPQLWTPWSVHHKRTPRFEARRDGYGRLRRRRVVRTESPQVLPLWVTGLEDTVLDTVQACASPEEAIGILTAANRHWDFSPDEAAVLLGMRRRCRYHELMADFLNDCRGVESVLEYRFLRDVLQAHGLPTGQRQVVLTGGSRHDVVIAEYGVIIELDGARHHASSEARFRDMQRDNASAVRGYVTLRFGWQDVVGRPCGVAAQIAQVLRQRGWSGGVRPCVRCQAN